MRDYDNFTFGQIHCYGCGEIGCSVYYKGNRCGEAFGCNGTQPDEPEYFPTIREWVDSISNEAYQRVISMNGGYSAKCKHCGEIYFSCDDKYRDEWTNSSEIAEEMAWESHLDFCRYGIYQEVFDHRNGWFRRLLQKAPKKAQKYFEKFRDCYDSPEESIYKIIWTAKKYNLGYRWIPTYREDIVIYSRYGEERNKGGITRSEIEQIHKGFSEDDLKYKSFGEYINRNRKPRKRKKRQVQ